MISIQYKYSSNLQFPVVELPARRVVFPGITLDPYSCLGQFSCNAVAFLQQFLALLCFQLGSYSARHNNNLHYWSNRGFKQWHLMQPH